MNTFFSILLSTTLIALISLVGVVVLFIKRKVLDHWILLLVSLSAGTLLGGAFFHLLPESIEVLGETALLLTLSSFFLFYTIEKVFHWRHCHKLDCRQHSFAYMNLIGDSIHNFIDGLVIAAAFMVSPQIGLATTIAVAIHEIPQEISDFGVLLHAGFKKEKALILNFLVALTVTLGGLTGFFAFRFFDSSLVNYLLPIAAGGFIYISASDLIPEIRNETEIKKSSLSLLVLFLGLLISFLFKFVGE